MREGQPLVSFEPKLSGELAGLLLALLLWLRPGLCLCGCGLVWAWL